MARARARVLDARRRQIERAVLDEALRLGDAREQRFDVDAAMARSIRAEASLSVSLDPRSLLHTMPIINATIMIFTRTVLFLNNIMTITAVDREKKARPKIAGPGSDVYCNRVSYFSR